MQQLDQIASRGAVAFSEAKGVSAPLCLPLSSSNEVVRTDLKKLPALPTQALKEHPSLAYW